jgi:hypothetical protein
MSFAFCSLMDATQLSSIDNMTLLLLFKWHGSAPTTFSKRKMTAT